MSWNNGGCRNVNELVEGGNINDTKDVMAARAQESYQERRDRHDRERAAGREAIRRERARVAAIIAAGTEDDNEAPAEWFDQ